MTRALHDARLTFELHANALERALGRGGAPIDVPRARDELHATEAALQALAVALQAGS